MLTACMYTASTIRALTSMRPCQGSGGSHVAYLNVETSRVSSLSMFHVAVAVTVGNLKKKGCRLSRFHFKCCLYFLGHVASSMSTGHFFSIR